MKPASLLLVLAMLVPALSGCTNDSNAQSAPPESMFKVTNQGVLSKNVAFGRKQTKVFSSLQEYAAELANYTDEPPLAIDFVPGRYLLVDMGLRGAGSSIAVTSVDVADASVTANVKLTQPRPGSLCLQLPVVTNPFQFVFIPSVKEILVSETLEMVDC